ncbi:MAG: outer membrane beta-barrel family protein [Ignavibacteria bacterium]
MTRIFISILFTFLYINSFSQTDPEKPRGPGNRKPSFADGEVSGYVFDRQTKTPLEAVSIKLIKSRDSSLYNGTETNSSGYFKLDNIEQGRYSLAIELTGYNKNTRAINLTDPQNKTISLDTIFLKTGTETEEIVVESEKPFIELKGDKKIFNVEGNMSVTGGTAIDVLKNLPSLTVDIDNNISLRGGQSIKYFINGRPVTGSISRILEQMPAEQLSSVEVITNPSAKFDAEGSTGVINLVLKKYDDTGFNGLLNMNAGTGDKYGSGLSLNYKTSKYNFTGSYDFRRRHNNFQSFVDRNNFFTPDNFLSDQVSDGRMKMDNNSARGEIEYYLSQTDLLSLNARYNNGNRNSGSTENLFVYDIDNNLNENSIARSTNTDKGETYSYGLNYNKLFKDKKQSLTGEASFSYDKDYENELKQTDYAFPVNTPSLFTKTDNKDLTKELNIQSDYAHPFGKTSKLETGLKFNYRDTRADNFYYNQNNLTGNYEIDTNLTDDFSFKENIASAYAIYGNEEEKFSYNLGIRGEYWKYDLNQFIRNSDISKDRIDYFPSVNVSQKLGLTEEISLSYSRRVRRPGYRNLSPVTRIRSSIFYSKGNPDLSPEYINSFELNFIKFFDSFSITPSIFYKITTDKITSYSTLIDSNITLSTPINANTENSYGGELLVNGSFSKMFSLNGSVSYFKQEINSDSLGTNSTNTFAGRLFGNITLPWDAAVQLTFLYRGKTATPQGIVDPVSTFDIALRKDFLDKKLSLNFRVSDIFNSQKMSGSTLTDLYSQTFSRQRESRVASLTLSYKFGTEDKNKSRDRKKRKTNDEPDGNDDSDF